MSSQNSDTHNEHAEQDLNIEQAEQEIDAFDTIDALNSADEHSPEQIALLIEHLQSENDTMKDKMMRTMAEMENLRRRTQKDVADAKTYAVASFARDLLGVGDNMRRALDSAPENSEDAALTTLVEGVQMTEREMLNTFEKHGIQKIEPEGHKFDPNFHQAMFEVENATIPNGTVVQVVAAGYVIGTRVLRPAMVGISKGGPKTVAAQNEAPTQPGDNIDIQG